MVTTMMIALGTIMGMSTVVATPTAQAADMPACWYTPTPEVQKNIQQQLYKLGLYKGNIDGKWLNLSIKAIQQAVYTWGGYTGPIDGAPGPNTCTNIQKLAGAKGQYTGSQDGVLGPRTWDGFLKALQAPPISVTSVKINPTGTITLKVGEKAALVAAVSPYTAWQKSVSWDSKYTSIATVTNGAVTAKTPGTTIITVTTKDGKRTDHVTVIVTGVKPPVDPNSLQGEFATLMKKNNNTYVIPGTQRTFYLWDNGCVTLSAWFIGSHTTLTFPRADGEGVVKGLVNDNKGANLKVSTTPTQFSVFSVSGSLDSPAWGTSAHNTYGHTGIVLSVNTTNKTAVVLETSIGRSGEALRSKVSTYSWPKAGVTFVDVSKYVR